MCMLISSRRRMRAARSSCSGPRFSLKDVSVSWNCAIWSSMALVTSRREDLRFSCSSSCAFTPASSAASMSSASPMSFSTSGTAVAPLPSAASSRAQASQRSSVLARSLAASAAWRLSVSRAMAARIAFFDILWPTDEERRRSPWPSPACAAGCFATSSASLRSRQRRAAGSVSLCHWRLTKARARRAHGLHFESRPGPPFSAPSSAAPAASSTSSKLGQSTCAPGRSMRSATEPRIWLSGPFSALPSLSKSSSARNVGALLQASSNSSKAWQRRSA
mmetsp:Transcript_103327/g.333295  ORF Transcript_103327/g.333295 Transcript_103327/m.333295 type:complete len:277 (-) Transcript_103327:306-1136(-)